MPLAYGVLCSTERLVLHGFEFNFMTIELMLLLYARYFDFILNDHNYITLLYMISIFTFNFNVKVWFLQH